jgi:dTDP-4-amino-4,6-dideoxygalactose transaminase
MSSTTPNRHLKGRLMGSQLALLGGSATVPQGAHGTWPEITDADRRAVMGVLDRGILTGGGSVEAPGFAREYAEYVAVRHCLPFNAGTAALHACAVATGMEPGDEAIVPAFTYVASAMAMALAGVKPVFADVELDTYLLDANDVEARITERTRAIVAVHLHGLACDLDALRAIADRHGLALIEDISQAHGAIYGDGVVGSFGACAGGSLNATKNLPGGEGGMFLANDDGYAVTARRLRYMGEDPFDEDPPAGRRYWSHGLGWNYRPQELPFAFARSQLRRLDGYNEIARRNARILGDGLRDLPGVIPPHVPEGREHVWYIYRVRLDPRALGWDGPATELRDRVMTALRAEGVNATYWQHDPLPAFTAFRRADGEVRPWVAGAEPPELAPWDPDAFPNATRICRETFVVGSGATPLAAQSEDLVRAYVEAFRKVMGSIDEVKEMAFELPRDTRDVIVFDASGGATAEPRMLPV